MHFHAETLSQDPRLHTLLRLAIRNMINVHTLRIVYGHMNLAASLIQGFLDQNRPRRVSLRRLWLESSCLSPNIIRVLSPNNTTGLESLRIRRLDVASLETMRVRRMGFLEYTPSRGGQYYQMHNGVGAHFGTTVQLSEEGLPERLPRFSAAELMEKAQAFDKIIWEELPEISDFVSANWDLTAAPPALTASVVPFRRLLECSTSTLTSLNLDWVIWRRKELDPYDDSRAILTELTALKFPHLRAFQVRNAVSPPTQLPDDVFLLEDTFLAFLEAHPKIQCLGWPIDKIYNHTRPTVEVQNRSRKLIAHLAMMLTDLRIDTAYSSHGEPLTDACRTNHEAHKRTRRRRFIAEFAPHMRSIEQIKLEGGIPRDEKREILRALHWCPLKKIVMIGVSFPAGNSWGSKGHELKSLDPGHSSDAEYNLDDEDLEGIIQSYRQGIRIPKDFQFEPDYGWSTYEVPLLQTVALHHAATVRELKLCGYNGCPILSQPLPITEALLTSLRFFDNLEQLVISLWLLTWFEDSYRDTEVIQSWLDARSPSSTALVVITPPLSPNRDFPVDPGAFPNFSATRAAPRQEFNRWAVMLKTRFTPSALAYRVARDIGPYLSPVAKNKPGGVRVRASFCLGIRDERRQANDIFDLDMRIGKDDQVLEFTGPREEGEKGRWWEKLETRRWF
jgi:hypothetical protein